MILFEVLYTYSDFANISIKANQQQIRPNLQQVATSLPGCIPRFYSNYCTLIATLLSTDIPEDNQQQNRSPDCIPSIGMAGGLSK